MKGNSHHSCLYHCFGACLLVWQPLESVQFSSVAHCVWLFATPKTAARQASLSITNTQRLPKLMSIETVMPSNHLILCRPLLHPPSIFPSIRVFSKESALRIRWPKYWSFRFNISPSNKYPGLISSRMEWLDLLSLQGTQPQIPAFYKLEVSHRQTSLRGENAYEWFLFSLGWN